MRPELQVITHPETAPDNIIQGDCWRISVLTSRLVRLEYVSSGSFEDRATQTVWNRNFEKNDFVCKDTGETLEITTAGFHLIYNKKPFSANGLSIQVQGACSAYHSIWHYGQEFGDLGGTARTLDAADGAIPLEKGLISRNGFSVLDDSRSLILTEEGWIEPRKEKCIDLYFWAYGHDYLGALKDFCHLCGKSPMVPRYALGNWWSRYYKYTEQSYKALMERFEKENIPFSVAVIDMDWHLVDIDPKYGSGWTGYTWNREFFPDPEGFLKWLHDKGMHVTLNVHPADGIRAYEDMYPQIAAELDLDTEAEEPASFDAADPRFLEACFKHVYHPHEEQGVDFWWIDWQSGGVSSVEGLDPLWVLNHYHYLDNSRNGKRPMTFSRYSGPGSHRYPVGFSGDTVITWDSLDFQPYFTATASNIGYGMWSHDIGGHMMGTKDDEMAGRWLQFGVFSPIMRLHSSCGEFNGKEPWRYKPEIRDMMEDFLRLRHRLIPYLYTMNHRAYEEDLPLILPMYYHYPENEQAYNVPNEYEFGTQLLAAPVTSPRIPRLNMAKTKVWLPEGNYCDIFTGRKYRGGRMLTMYRDIRSIPVLARAGAILPMTEDIQNAGSNPEDLHIHLYAGGDGSFTLYEDDNMTEEYKKGRCAVTKMQLTWGADAVFRLAAPEGCTDLLPPTRSYTILLHSVLPCRAEAIIEKNTGTLSDADMEQSYDEKTNTLICRFSNLSVSDGIRLTFRQTAESENDILQGAFDFLNQAEISFLLKEQLYSLFQKYTDRLMLMSQIQTMDLDTDLAGVLTEIITA